MRIFFQRYNNICETDYVNAFKALGIEVVENWLSDESGCADVRERMELVGRKILEVHPMFVFSIYFFPYISIVCEAAGVKYVSVCVGCPSPEIYNTAIRNRCNRVFLFDHAQYMTICDENPECVFHMPLGVDVCRIDEAIGEYNGHKTEYQYDVSFVGSLYTEKNPYSKLALSPYYEGYFEGLISAQELLPGIELIEQSIRDEDIRAIKEADPNFHSSELSVRNLDGFMAVHNYLGGHLTVRDRLKLMEALCACEPGDAMIHLFTNSDVKSNVRIKNLDRLICHDSVDSVYGMPKVFRLSKININHTMRSIKTGLPQRIWDVLGSGGFLLTNDQTEIPEYLTPGVHLETYSDFDEMNEKIEYYLSHDEEREEIAMNGYTEVKAHHTVLNRVMDMIRVIY